MASFTLVYYNHLVRFLGVNLRGQCSDASQLHGATRIMSEQAIPLILPINLDSEHQV